MFELNIFVFHNSNPSTISYFKEINKVNNSHIISYKDITYSECIRKSMNFMNDILTDLVFFIQDDGLSYEFFNYEELFSNIKEDDYYALGYSYFDMETEPEISNPPYFKYLSKSFTDSGFWPMDDSPYLTSLNKLKEIYDETYLKQSNIYKAESYLANKYFHYPIIKTILDSKLFINVNTIGLHAKENANSGGNLVGDAAIEYRSLFK